MLWSALKTISISIIIIIIIIYLFFFLIKNKTLFIDLKKK